MRHTLVLPVLVLLLAPAAFAGKGTYVEGTPDDITLYVLFEFDSQPAEWEPMFRAASHLLYNATQQQVRIGRVVVYDDCKGKTGLDPDAVIHKGDGRANANVGGFGKGGVMNFYETHKAVTTGTTAGPRGYLGFAHELGHYLFYLNDEYLGKTTADGFCVAQSGQASCIMDSGTKVETTNQRTEFCFVTDHQSGTTAQDKKRMIGTHAFENTSCWSFLREYVDHRHNAALTAPSAAPVSDDGGHGDGPVFEYRDCSDHVFVGVADAASRGAEVVARSLSTVETGTPLTLIGATETSLAPKMNARERSGLRDAVRAEAALTGEQDTAELGRIIARTLSALKSPEADPASVVLYTESRTPIDVDALRAFATDRKVDLNFLAYGSSVEATHARLAESTGGTWLHARTEERLASNTMAELNELQSRPLVELREGSIPAGGTQDVTFTADALTADPGMVVSVWTSNGSVPQVTVNGAETPESVERVDESGFARISTHGMKPGTWTVRLTNTSGSAKKFAVVVSAESSELSLDAYSDDAVVPAGGDLAIRAYLATEAPVGNARVEADVLLPGGQVQKVTLRDDGEGGDVRKDDGLYSGVVAGVKTPGAYTVDVTANTSNARTVNPESNEEPFTSRPVPPSIRKSRFSAVVVAQ
ncbi:MAG TPA: choice-of-anchor X domain-containing protein [Thermoanaerobaculia bacterium]|nr:choice-of-anchor X domain-containing protein [Thermoanaerobaculia bacterium]